MSKSYTPGLKILENASIKKKRILPLAGELHVEKDDLVKSNQIVASAKIPGNVQMINISNELNIKKFMFLAASDKSLSRSSDKITGDCLEALIGAIYLDGGLKSAEKFILNFWKKYLENSTLPLIDSKTQLQEYSLKKFKELPKYTFYKKTGPQHKPLFKTDVQIPNSKKAIGIGTSKKNAQQDAASKLLYSLKIL